MSESAWRSRGNIVPRGSRSRVANTDSSSTPQDGGAHLQSQSQPWRGTSSRGYNSGSSDQARGGGDRGHGQGRERGRWRGQARGGDRDRGGSRAGAWINGRGSGRGNQTYAARRQDARSQNHIVAASASPAHDDEQRRLAQRAEKYSRLKPLSLDPLQEIGLPSKGDDRLLSHSLQESYFGLIRSRHEKLYGALPAAGSTPSAEPQDDDSSVTSSATTTAITATIATGGSKGVLWAAMRGLREGLFASQRRDDFAVRAYVFVARAAILGRAGFEAYVPALRHLLYRMAVTDEPATGLTQPDGEEVEGDAVGGNVADGRQHRSCVLDDDLLQELAAYYILDLACRRGAFLEAFEARKRWLGSLSVPQQQQQQQQDLPTGSSITSSTRLVVDGILRGLVHGDWITFWRARERADAYQRRLIEAAEGRVRAGALTCLAKTYFTVSKGYVKTCAGGEDVDDLVRRNEVAWEVEEEVVVIRRAGKK